MWLCEAVHTRIDFDPTTRNPNADRKVAGVLQESGPGSQGFWHRPDLHFGTEGKLIPRVQWTGATLVVALFLNI